MDSSVSDSWTQDMNAEAVSTLRHRLNAFKESFGDDLVGEALNQCDSTEAAARRSAKRAAKRRNGNCMDTLIDGSFMGMVLAVCLSMVVGATFFAYKNLYYAVMKKVYPDGDSNINSYEVTP